MRLAPRRRFIRPVNSPSSDTMTGSAGESVSDTIGDQYNSRSLFAADVLAC